MAKGFQESIAHHFYESRAHHRNKRLLTRPCLQLVGAGAHGGTVAAIPYAYSSMPQTDAYGKFYCAVLSWAGADDAWYLGVSQYFGRGFNLFGYWTPGGIAFGGFTYWVNAIYYDSNAGADYDMASKFKLYGPMRGTLYTWSNLPTSVWFPDPFGSVAQRNNDPRVLANVRAPDSAPTRLVIPNGSFYEGSVGASAEGTTSRICFLYDTPPDLSMVSTDQGPVEADSRPVDQ